MKKFNENQLKVLRSDSDRLLVSASAGSGKTTVMIEKIIGLVRDGKSLKNMLVSTFTKAAAADIKAKLYDGLYRERGNPHVKEELEQLAFADITNLHSWCQRQISQYFYRLGVDPDFSVIDDTEADTLMDLCLSEVIEEESKLSSPDFVLLYEILLSSRKDNALKNYVKQIYSFALLQPDPASWLKRYKEIKSESELKEKIAQITAQKKAVLIKRVRELERLTTGANFVRNLPYIEELIDYLHSVTDELSVPHGSIAEEFKPLNEAFATLKGDVKEFVAESEELSKMDYCEQADENAAVLSRMAARLMELYHAAKAEKSALDFSDLEHCMLKLLDDKEVAAELCEKYKYIFVDEYQDINPLQETILNTVCIKSKVFYVGDVKQSIYAFRGCEPAIFLEKYHLYQNGANSEGFSQNSGGEVIRLNENYRSDSRILEFCNDLFKEIMTEGFGGLDYGRDGMFVAGKGNIGFAPEFIIVRDKEKEKAQLPSVYSVREHTESQAGSLSDSEQNLVVSKVLQLMTESICEGGGKRPVNLSDIVILVRSSGEYVSALKTKLGAAGIEVSVGEKLNFASEQVTAVLLQYLELINNFDNDIALLTVMRSVFGGFSDEELTAIRASDMYSDYYYKAARGYNKKDAIKDKLNAFFDKLKSYHSLSLYLPADELLDRIVSDADYFKYVFSLTDGKSKAELLESFLNFAEASPYKKNIFGFLRHLSKGACCEACPPKANAVRIMTVHSSKGLEFPFVIFANSGKRFNIRDSYDRIILDKDYGVCLKRFDEDSRTAAKSPAWYILQEKLKKTMLEEELRILYVALTRAVYGLFVFGSAGEDDKSFRLFEAGEGLIDYSAANNYLTWLLPVMKKYASFYKIADCSFERGEEALSDRIPYFTEFDQKLCDGIKKRIGFTYPHGHAIRKTFVTAAAKTDTEQEAAAPVYFSGDDKALIRGSAYHKAMELIDFYRDFDEEFAKLDTQIKELINYDEIKIAVSKMKELAGKNKIYKEIPFILSCPFKEISGGEINGEINGGRINGGINGGEISGGKINEKVLIQGVIDALIMQENDAIIVDYKTTKAQELVSPEYTKQLSIYSKAVTDILKIPVKDAFLYSFAAKNFIKVSL